MIVVETPQEEPFPTLIVAVIVTIAAVAAAVLAYFKVQKIATLQAALAYRRTSMRPHLS